MRKAQIRERAFAMPLTSPAYPRGPYLEAQFVRCAPVSINVTDDVLPEKT